jgi:histidyl-tRNA synthetase
VRTQLAVGGHSLKSQLRLAGRLGVRYTVILGEDELRGGTVTVRDMQRGEQQPVPRGEVAARLAHWLTQTAVGT